MDSIKAIVSKVINGMASGTGVHVQDLQSAWNRVVADKDCRVVDFKDGCLTVSADSSLRLIRLNLERENILRSMQKEFPSVVKINFKVGKY